MKINEILVESQQINEGPLGSAAGAAARGAGKAIGGVAKAAGAIAGVGQGVKRAFQKGKQASIRTIGGDDAAQDTAAAPAAAPGSVPADPAVDQTAAPAAQPQGFIQGVKQGLGLDKKAPQTGAEINKQGPTGTAPAKVAGGAQQQALAKTAQAVGGDTEKANQTVYAQVKAQVDQLDKKGKQRILQLLQKSLQQTPAAQPAQAAPAAQPAQAAPAQQPAAAPAPAAAGEQPAAAAGKKKPAPKKKVAPSQAEIDADRARIMGPTSDSVIRTGNVVSESFTLYRR